jgi:hypothetical protein
MAKKVDPLAALLDDAKTIAPKKPGAKKKERELIELDASEARAFDRFCMADAALKMAKGHQEGSKASILPVVTDKMLQMWCEEGHRTDNPRVQTENGQAILQARETLRFELPANEDGSVGTVTEMLQSVGFSEEKAEEIREREFTETTELRFANISKLREDPKSKKLVDKLLTLVLENFEPEDRKVLLEKVNNVTLKEGFLDRSVAHVDRDPALLKALFQVVRPTFLMSHIVWKGDLNDAVKTLEGTTAETLTTPAIKIPAATTVAPKIALSFKSDDGQWKASYVGLEATLFMVQGGTEIEMKKKTCTNEGHAKATCQKWMRDPAYRAETLKK